MAAWAPEFLEFPEWAAGAQVMFADAASWNRPIRFAKGVGGHAAALDVAEAAQAMNVARLVFAHVGRSTIRARCW
jgi:ribonuclease BN (tRNA processing enzyme)